MSLQILRGSEHQAMPWKNGQGVTHEVARSPIDPATGEFNWRISFASVETSGPFSLFPEVDRVITLVDGPEMKLTFDGGMSQVLRRFELFTFAGDRQVWCETVGPTVDFNVMTRRGRAAARVACHRLTGQQCFVPEPSRLVSFVAVLDGCPHLIGPGGELELLCPHDVVINSESPVTLAGAAVVATVGIVDA